MAYAYDFFIDENPDVIERVDRRGREALQEGSLRTSRKIALNYVQRRFPALTLLAQQRVAHISQIEPLETLLDQLFGATNEDEARKLLEAQGN